MTLGELLNTIIENRCILNLIIESEIASVSELDFKRLVNEHLLIEELTFCRCRFTVGAVVMGTQQLNHLKQFSFQVNSRAEYDRLCNKLDNKWQTQIYHSEIVNAFVITLNC